MIENVVSMLGLMPRPKDYGFEDAIYMASIPTPGCAIDWLPTIYSQRSVTMVV